MRGYKLIILEGDFMNHFGRYLLLSCTLMLALSIPLQLFAQRGGGGPSRFSAGVYGLFGTGKMGNGGSNDPGFALDRNMLYTSVGLFAGISLKKFRVGLNYEYMMAGQQTEPAEVANTNMSGTGGNVGLRLEYYDGTNAIGAVVHLADTYKLDKTTFAGDSAEYKGGPAKGFSVQYMRRIKNKIGIILDYTTGEYNESLTTGPVKWNRMGLGIVFSNFAGK